VATRSENGYTGLADAAQPIRVAIMAMIATVDASKEETQ